MQTTLNISAITAGFSKSYTSYPSKPLISLIISGEKFLLIKFVYLLFLYIMLASLHIAAKLFNFFNCQFALVCILAANIESKWSNLAFPLL